MPPFKKTPTSSSPKKPSNPKITAPAPQRATLTRPSQAEETRRIIRPSFDTLESDRPYNVRIADASVLAGNGQDRLKLNIEFFNSESESLLESLLLQVDWKPGSPFRELLEVTDLMPEPKGELDIDALSGREMLMTVRINVKDGRSFTNVFKTELLPDELDAEHDNFSSEETQEIEDLEDGEHYE